MDNLKIIRLEAENVKRLRAVSIDPDGSLVEISGPNESGKSSVLNAIWLALGGREASSSVTTPLRNGTAQGYVSLDLGDITVLRTFTKDKSTLTVKSTDGAKFPSPQSLLDGLRAKFLDPQAFIDLKPKEQREALLQLVDLGIDLDEHARERADLYNKRKEIGQEGKALGDIGDIDPSLPETETSASELISQLQEAQEVVRKYKDAQDLYARQQQRLAELQSQLEAVSSAMSETQKYLSSVTALPDVDSYTERLQLVEESNRAIRTNNERKEKKSRVDALVSEYESLTEKIAAHDKVKFDALKSAKLPVDGLTIEDEYVALNGVPFGDCSTAQKLVASLKIAASGDPKLRIIQIQRGESLDDKNFEVVREFASENDFQIWVETVGDGHSEAAVIMDDGEVS